MKKVKTLTEAGSWSGESSGDAGIPPYPEGPASIAQRVDFRPGPWPHDAVYHQPAIALEAPDRGLRVGAEDAVDAIGVVATQRQPLLCPPDGVSGRTPADGGVAVVGLVDVQPRDVADDAVDGDPL